MKKYDVIIVGAGVSGLRLAKLLDNSNLNVLLLEKKNKINIEPKEFGTFTKTVKEHGLEKYIKKYFDIWAFYGPTVKSSKMQKKVMCLVNYHKWANDFKPKNVKIKTSINIQKAKRVKGGILLRDNDHNSYFGKLIVDSSGYVKIVHRLLGLPTNKQTGFSYELGLDNCNFPFKNEASFILNFNATNSGGWLYIISKKKAQYGWAEFYPESKSNLNSLKQKTLLAMDRIDPQNKWLKNAKITYSYGRLGPTGNIPHKVYDNLISIGDAGGFGTPVTLEGFREALDSAKMASKVILKSKQYSKNELRLFLDLFYDKYGRYYKMHKLVRFIYLHWMRNKDLDRWITNFEKFNKTDFFKLIQGQLTIKLMLKTLDLKLIISLCLNIINNTLPSFLQFRIPITSSKKEVLYEKN